jgi:hypothetical protein
MKQVKSLVLAVYLVFALSAGAHGGDIGSPGITTPIPTETPKAAATSTLDPNTTTISDTSYSSDLSSQLVLDMVLVLLTFS